MSLKHFYQNILYNLQQMFDFGLFFQFDNNNYYHYIENL